jgi:hypothetical protein
VTQLRPYDVLFGRGSGPNDHEGNIRFRQIVADRKAEYMATNHRMTKAKIAKEIVDQVFASYGRFMKKVEQAELRVLGMPDTADVWQVVGDDTVMEKAKQALRQNTQKQKGEESPGKISPKPFKAKESCKPAPRVDSLDPRARSGQQQQPVDANYDDFEPLPIASYDTDPRPSAMNPPAPVHAWNGDQNGNRYPEIVSSLDMVGVGIDNSAGRDARNGDTSGDTNSMLSYVSKESYELNDLVPSHNVSMVQIPQEEPSSPINRRGSITIGELSNHHGRRHHTVDTPEVSGLMDSFSKMRASDERRRQTYDPSFHASVDTMGTIEQYQHGSIADMSIGTMESSTFSLFRGNESMAAMDDKIAQVEAEVQAEVEREHSQEAAPPMRALGNEPSFTLAGLSGTAPPHPSTNNASMSLSDVWGNNRRKSSTGAIISSLLGSKDTVDHLGPGLSREGHREGSSFPPRPGVRLTEEEPGNLGFDDMGSSSMQMLKSIFSLDEVQGSPTDRKSPQQQHYAS